MILSGVEARGQTRRVRTPFRSQVRWLTRAATISTKLMSNYFRHLGAVLTALSIAACARVQREAPVGPQPCMFSGPPKSALAWQSGPGSFNVRGRAVSVRDGRPIPGALVRLSPGPHYARADTAGFFELRSLRGGRYYVEVVVMGHIRAADSLTVGDDGAFLLAAIADYTPDIGCSR
jgi:hypothetical protein